MLFRSAGALQISGDMVEYDVEEDRYNKEEAEGFERLIDKVWDIMEDQHWYDQKMFEIYHTTNMSMRDIEKETGISLFSIFDTLRKSKEYVKEKINEDYEDYNNEDYELI